MRRDVFQAIADPTRRAIILLVAFQAMTPNAIAEHFDTSRQAVSKHLKILSECELVKQKQSGREIYYQINANSLKHDALTCSRLQNLHSTTALVCGLTIQMSLHGLAITMLILKFAKTD